MATALSHAVYLPRTLMTHSLGSLNEREREVLRLLSQGHTAKTISRTQGLSINTVNDRLRSARRKTGASSSRELARLLISLEHASLQESGDKFLGVEKSPLSTDLNDRKALATSKRPTTNIWRAGMILSVLLAAGLLAFETSVTVQSAPPAHIGSQSTSLPRINVVGRHHSFTGTQYQAACLSSDPGDREYCAGMIVGQMMRHGPSDDQLCLPTGADGAWDRTTIAGESSLAVARVPEALSITPSEVALAALKATYPCRTEAQLEEALPSRILPVWVALQRGGERVAVGAGERFVVELTTGDGLPVSRFSNAGTGGYVNEAAIGMAIEGRFLPRTGQPVRVFRLTGVLYGADGSVISRAEPVTLRLPPRAWPSTLRPTLTFPT